MGEGRRQEVVVPWHAPAVALAVEWCLNDRRPTAGASAFASPCVREKPMVAQLDEKLLDAEISLDGLTFTLREQS